MSGPGGETVGKVNIKVVPDTSDFANDLKRKLRRLEQQLKVEIPVEFDVDPQELRAKIEAIRVPTINVPVDVDVRDVPTVPVDADTSAARAEVNEFVAQTERRDATIDVEVDRQRLLNALETVEIKARLEVDEANLRAQVARAAAATDNVHTVRVRVEANSTALDRSLVSIRNGFSRTARFIQRDFAAVPALFSGIGRVVVGVASNISSAFSGLGGVIGTLVQASAVATGLALAGAGITAAWGLVSTVIAAVPAALGLIGAPLAAVMLGMDGIAKAAKVLKPEFDKLGKAVSSTFQKGLTPVFNQLRGSITRLIVPIQGVADSLVELAQRTADYITKGQGLARVQTLFRNVASAIDDINLTPLLDGFLRLAGNRAALGALVTVVNDLGLGLQAIANNKALDRAFQGLGQVLGSLTQAFIELVNNGIELFAAAAPGLREVLDSITNFFSRFNWTSLGKSVGGVFEGIARAVDQIPPETIRAIEDSFARLADVFKSPEFQQGVKDFAALMPTAIDAIGRGVSIFSRIVTAIKDVIVWVRKADVAWQEWMLELGLGSEEAVRTARENLNRELGIIPSEVNAKLGEVTAAFNTKLGEIPGVAGQQGTAAANAFVGSVGTITPQTQGILGGLKQFFETDLGGLAPIAGEQGQKIVGQWSGALELMAPRTQGILSGLLPAVTGPLAPLPGQAGVAGGQTAQGFTENLSPIVPNSQGILDGLNPALGESLNPLGPTAQAGGRQLVAGFGSGISPISTELQTELGLLPPIATAGAGDVPPALQTGLAGVQDAIATGMVPAQQSMTNSLNALSASVQSTFGPQLGAAVSTAMTQMSTAVTTGINQVRTTFQTGLASLGPIVAQAFSGQIVTAVATAMVQMSTAVTTGMAQVRTALQTGLTGLGPIVTQVFAGQIVAAVTAGMTQMSTAVTTGFATVRTAFQTGLTGINTAITTGMQQAVQALQAGLQQINQAATQAGTQLANAGRQMMDQFVQAVRQGAEQAVAAVRPLVGQMRSAIPANGLQPVGVALMQGLRAGIMARAQEIANAAAAVVRRAIAAARNAANSKSPSKETRDLGLDMGLGLELGLLGMRDRVADAGKALALEAIHAAQGVEDAFNFSSTALDTDRLNAKIVRSAELAGTPIGGDGARQVVINAPVYNPQPERASTSVNRKLRTLAALGAFE